MAQPIPLHLAPRDQSHELEIQLKQARLDHAEALLAGYEILQALHDKGLLELVRGALGGSEKILAQFVAVANEAEAIRAARNLLLLSRALGDVEPALLGDFTRAIPKALVKANLEGSKPPGLIKLVSTFWKKDFRRGLSAFNDLLVMFGRNLMDKVPVQEE